MRGIWKHLSLSVAMISAIVLVYACLTPMAVNAEAANYVSVAGTYLYNGDSITCGDGTATYKDGVLTLDNATIEDSTISTYGDLVINLVGNNSITCEDVFVVNANKNLTITGEGTLSIRDYAYHFLAMGLSGQVVTIQDCGGVKIETNSRGITTHYPYLGDRRLSYLTVKNTTLEIISHETASGGVYDSIFSNYMDIEDSKVVVIADRKSAYAIGIRDNISISGNSEVIVSSGFGHFDEDSPVMNIYGDAEILVGDALDGSDAENMEGAPFKDGVKFSTDEFDTLSRKYVYIKTKPAVEEPGAPDTDKEAPKDDPADSSPSSDQNIEMESRKTTTATETASDNSHICKHSYGWEIYKEATATTDGIMRYRCKYCGTVEYEVPTAAYYVFNKETQESIKNAASNATVTVETPIFISFHEMVKDALVERPDVTLVVDYRNGGKNYEMTIPAGSANTLETLYGESQYAGFLYLSGAFATVAQ